MRSSRRAAATPPGRFHGTSCGASLLRACSRSRAFATGCRMSSDHAAFTIRDRIQEVLELGLRRTAFRIGWELRTRTGLGEQFEATPVPLARVPTTSELVSRL